MRLSHTPSHYARPLLTHCSQCSLLPHTIRHHLHTVHTCRHLRIPAPGGDEGGGATATTGRGAVWVCRATMHGVVWDAATDVWRWPGSDTAAGARGGGVKRGWLIVHSGPSDSDIGRACLTTFLPFPRRHTASRKLRRRQCTAAPPNSTVPSGAGTVGNGSASAAAACQPQVGRAMHT